MFIGHEAADGKSWRGGGALILFEILNLDFMDVHTHDGKQLRQG